MKMIFLDKSSRKTSDKEKKFKNIFIYCIFIKYTEIYNKKKLSTNKS